MNLQTRIKEVSNHIADLQETANKHKENGNTRAYLLSCEVIESNKEILKVLREDLRKHRKIISLRYGEYQA